MRPIISRGQQRPIKYKQFIQQLQNSSRSSNQDQSLLSQRSFRDSCSFRDNEKKDGQKNSLQRSIDVIRDNSKQKSDNSSKNQKGTVQGQNKMNVKSNMKDIKDSKDMKDKLYTFCDANKLTEKSIEIPNIQNNSSKQGQKKSSKQREHNKVGLINSSFQGDRKYFKTARSNNSNRNSHKQNINFVNQILSKVQSEFQSKVQKKQSPQSAELSLLSSIKPLTQQISNDPHHKEPHSLLKSSEQLHQSQIPQSTPSNSHKKITTVNRIYTILSSKHKISKNIFGGNQSKLENALENNGVEDPRKQQSQKKNEQSSKKKIVSLNINSIHKSMNTNANSNKTKIKLSLDNSSKENLNVQSNGLFSSLQQKKMSSPNLSFYNQNSRGILQQSQLNSSMEGFKFKKQIRYSHEKNKGSTKSLVKQGPEKQINESVYLIENGSKQKLKHHVNMRSESKDAISTLSKQLQIVKKDCFRLNSSYKQIKKLYEQTKKEKEDLQMELQKLQSENMDLKECLCYKSEQLSIKQKQLVQKQQELVRKKNEIHSKQRQLSSKQKQLSLKDKQVNQLYNKIQQLQEQTQQLTHQLQQMPSIPSNLTSLIKQKLIFYEQQMASLQEQNSNLLLLKEKLQSFNQQIKLQLQEKQELILELEDKLKGTSGFNLLMKSTGEGSFNASMINMKRSESAYQTYRNHYNNCNDSYYEKKIKEVQSKLKLSQLHNQYLTNQIVQLKAQKQLLLSNIAAFNNSNTTQNSHNSQPKNDILTNSSPCSPLLQPKPHLSNTITTRNSSISGYSNSLQPYSQNTNTINNMNSYEINTNTN